MSKPESLRPRKRPASAIIVALAIIALISVVTLTLSSLSQLGERNNAARKESVLARKNALLGLRVAIGQIQENLGVDQAITLNARHYNRHDNLSDADDANDAKKYAKAWTAALPSSSEFKWESPNEGDPPVWLVSGNGIGSNSSIKPDTDVASLLHVELGVNYTDRITAIPVKAPLKDASVHASSGKPTGRYAYWVDDEGMKARVNYFDLGMHKQRTDLDTNLDIIFTSTPKTGIEILNIPSPSDTEVPKLSDGTGRHDYQKGLIGNILKGQSTHPFASFFYPWSKMLYGGDPATDPAAAAARDADPRDPLELNRLRSIRGLERWLDEPNIYQLRETLTFNSHGVLSDTKDGGLKQDLSYLFVADLTDDAIDDDISNRFGSDKILTATTAPSWKQLADGVQGSDRLGDYRPWTQGQHGYTGGSWLWGFSMHVKVDAWKEGDSFVGRRETYQVYKYQLILEFRVYGDRRLKDMLGNKPFIRLTMPDSRSRRSPPRWRQSNPPLLTETLVFNPILETQSGILGASWGGRSQHDVYEFKIYTNQFVAEDEDGMEIPTIRDEFSINAFNAFWNRGTDGVLQWHKTTLKSKEYRITLQEHPGDPWKIDFKEAPTSQRFPLPGTFNLSIWKSYEDFKESTHDPNILPVKAIYEKRRDNPNVLPVHAIYGLPRKAYPYLVGNDHTGLSLTAVSRDSDNSISFEARPDPPEDPPVDRSKTLYSYYWGLPKFWSARLMQPMLGTPMPYASRYNAYGPIVGFDSETGYNPIYQGGLFSRAALRQWVEDLPPVGNHPSSIPVTDEEPRDTALERNLDRRVAAYDPHWFLEGFHQEDSVNQYGVTQTLPEFSQIRFPWAPDLNYPRKASDKTSIYERVNTPQLLKTLGNGAELIGPATRQPDTNISPNTDRSGINIAWQFRNVQPRGGFDAQPQGSLDSLNRSGPFWGAPYHFKPNEGIPTNPIGNSWLPAWFGLDSSSNGLPDRESSWAAALSRTEYLDRATNNSLHNYDFTHHDWCYKLNEALWDRYFFSKAAYKPNLYYQEHHELAGDYGPINRFTILNNEFDVFGSNNEIDTFDRAAANALSTWVLNVNTPHIDGWKNAIGAKWNHLERDTASIPREFDLSRTHAEGDASAPPEWLTAIINVNPASSLPADRIYGSLGTPSREALRLASSGYFNADDNYAFALDHRPTTDARARHAASPLDTDLRRGGIYHNGPAALLNLRHVNNIARILTEQVAVRGPYKSLGQFINRDKDAIDKEGDDEDRKLQNRRRQIEGVLQYAIDESGANDFLFAAEDGIEFPGLATYTGATSSAAMDAYWQTGYKLDYFNETDPANQTHNTTYRTYYIFHGKKMSYRAGIPAYVSQAKLLESIGHIITPRSDTFTIHFYGESTNPITGKAMATARGKAVVQRLPEFIDSANKPWDWSRSGTNSNVSPRDGEVNAVNLRFGRRFVVTSIQWE